MPAAVGACLTLQVLVLHAAEGSAQRSGHRLMLVRLSGVGSAAQAAGPLVGSKAAGLGRLMRSTTHMSAASASCRTLGGGSKAAKRRGVGGASPMRPPSPEVRRALPAQAGSARGCSSWDSLRASYPCPGAQARWAGAVAREWRTARCEGTVTMNTTLLTYAYHAHGWTTGKE
jgi:hypothetical protein